MTYFLWLVNDFFLFWMNLREVTERYVFVSLCFTRLQFSLLVFSEKIEINLLQVCIQVKSKGEGACLTVVHVFVVVLHHASSAGGEGCGVAG